PAWMSARAARGAVADPTRRGLEVYPVRAGRVLEEAAVRCAPEQLEAAVGALAWPEAAGEDDWPWLLSWLHAPRRKGRYILLSPR
ncbi:MAG TPA: hypothetical protein VFO85_15530, partial [Vicinamibacteria bacterium]|nr:hypothetical protein [Vicinamibacteria bacterium]